MKDDLISRQAAIDAFLTELTKRERKNLLHTWSTVEVKYFVVDMLEKLPSAQPVQWIPCSERLPEELTPVNVVWVNHNPQLYYSKIKDVPQSDATAVYFCGRWYWWDAVLIDWLGEYGQCGREESLVDKDIEITHWMPLPEPLEVNEQ
jgi:hypothetical protein